MSYINEALKKAQKKKEAKSINYVGSPELSGEISRFFHKKHIFFALIFIFIIIIIFFLHSGLKFLSGSNRDDTKKILSGEITDQYHEKDNSVTVTESNPVDQLKNNKAIDADKNNDENLYIKAVSLTKQGRIQEAKSVYRKILILSPGNTVALNDLGVLLLHEGEFRQAEIYLEKAVRLDPDNVNPYYNLACLQALYGNSQKGIEYLKKAVKIDIRVKDWIREDTDLEGLKDLPEFKEILK
ncbi:tetratricopeptide repeat protein [Thermodesulfobacteriota bacterium]